MVNEWFLRRRRAPGTLALATALMLSGCSDPSRNAVSAFVRGQVPDGVELIEITSITMTKHPEGGFDALVDVRYRALENLVSFKDGFSTAEGRGIGLRMDAVRDWAASELTESDPARIEIEDIWKEARSGFAIKRIGATAGEESAGTVEVHGRRDGDELVLVEHSNPVVPSGVPDRRPDIPTEGTAAARLALDERIRMAFALESIQSAWRERERRAAESLASLREMLRAGVTFDGTFFAPGKPVPLRLVISRSLGDRDAIGVLTDQGTPVSSIRMIGGLMQTDTGEFAWRISATELISRSPDAVEIFDPRRGAGNLFLVADEGRLKGRTESGLRIELIPGTEVDVIEEAAD